jgi:glutamate synthase (NADPH/NADH) small chain
MGASSYEQHLAQTDGVLIRTGVTPRRVLAEDGRVVGVELERTADGERVTIACDQLFRAIGQALVADDVAPIATERGRIVVDDERRTSRAGVWAGGDCVLGGDDLTVAAVEDGKRAAASIDRALREGNDG